MNSEYLQKISDDVRDARQLAAAVEVEFLKHGAPYDSLKAFGDIIRDVAQDAEDLVKEVSRLNEELRQQGLAELTQRPWEWDEERKRLAQAASGTPVYPCQAYKGEEWMRLSEEELAKIAAAVPGDELIWEEGSTWDRFTMYTRVTVVRKTATRIMVRSPHYNELAFHLKNGRCVGSDKYSNHLRFPEGEVLVSEQAYAKKVALDRMREKISADIYRMGHEDISEVFELIKHLKAERLAKKENLESGQQ